ncbi:cytochrome c oxidase subunit II [Marivita sp.]|uniref:cytochrome c oxidase subunit II n=1 Tax=Marivita sp. TaxID=2003365 RepID=UPI0025BC2AFD|nr:cytochrome c oxidase subunit II [Marivita sp.]
MGSTLDQFGSQTTFADAGIGAARTVWLTNSMSIISLVILAFVMLVALFAWRSTGGGRVWWIIGGGIVFPLITLSVLTVASATTLRSITGEAQPEAPVIEITAYQYWWDVVHHSEGRSLRDANEIVLPLNMAVTLQLKSNDVIHSFWVPSVSGKMDMIPGRINELTITATKEGRFRGQCAEFCGLSHPLMAFEVLVLPVEEYAAYLESLDEDARDAVTPQQRRGKEVFLTSGCTACHAVNGVSENGRLGPDLSRVGARASLGAGMWRMNRGNLAGWIADVGDMKPGAQMPSYNDLSGPDLRAVAAWLESLK